MNLYLRIFAGLLLLSTPHLAFARDVVVGGKCKDDFCTIFEVEVFNKQAAHSTRDPAGVYIENSTAGTEEKLFFGLYVATESIKCRKSAIVPKQVFDAIVGMFDTIAKLTAAGSTPPAYTPAQQTMLLFYTTIMEQTQQFECNIQGAALEGSNN